MYETGKREPDIETLKAFADIFNVDMGPLTGRVESKALPLFWRTEGFSMKKFSTADRLNQIMKTRNLRQVDILRAAEPFCKKYGVKLGKNDMSQYVSGKVEPGQDKLTILGLALSVSEAWLMGYDVSPDREIPPTAISSDGRVQEYVQLFELLTNEQKELIIHAIKGILSEK